MSAATYRLRSELRNRWRAWLALAMLVGAVAGASLVLVAGSRRTGSAHDRFRNTQRAFDVAVSCGRITSQGAGEDTSCFHDLVRLPAVAGATIVTTTPALIATLDGRSIQPDPSDPCYSGPGLVHAVFDASGR